jgi:hypothetical protein
MTQFLLWASTEHPPDGYVATKTDDIDWLRLPAASIFPNANAIVKVAPLGDELDSIADEAREQMIEGMSVQSTRLGVLLKDLARRSSFALFWGNDCQDLPVVFSLAELWGVLGPQICKEQGNWELYVVFQYT